jgi:glucose/arabinose dehydrogenase
MIFGSNRALLFAILTVPLTIACSSGGGNANDARAASNAATPTPVPGATATPTAAATATSSATNPPAADSRLVFAPGFSANVVGNVGGARELATLPNGDMLIGTGGSTIFLLPNADAATSGGAPAPFITLSEGPAEGVAYGPNGAIYAATNTTIWKIAYKTGDRAESNAVAIAHVRTGSVAPNSDGDIHRSTSVVATASKVYAGVGSSCNSCIETDPTRASVQQMNLDGSAMSRLAENARNPIALAIDPATASLWIGGAGQDSLPYSHPYEYVDSPTLHGTSNVNYGWPACEENHHLYNPRHQNPAPDCSQTVAPAIEFPAYSTLVGATFYPAGQGGTYAFPAAYKGGLFVTSHGSWHCCPSTPPRVYFVPMSGDSPAVPANWSDPTVQGQPFVSGFGTSGDNNYIGRPTGIAVGSNGSLFFTDDDTGNIIRIRPH